MPYDQNQKRRVIYQCPSPDPIVSKPKNIIVQWEQPDVCVKKDIKHLGVVCANPCEYIQKYGSCIKQSCDLPQFVKDIPPQCGVELAANKPTDQCPVFELCGDVCGMLFFIFIYSCGFFLYILSFFYLTRKSIYFCSYLLKYINSFNY